MSEFESTGEFKLLSQFNPTVGRAQWKMVNSDYDYVQEIARSSYADMLHDADRNEKYRAAIQTAIATRRRLHPLETVRVLDIGTGTGLLSMMAAEANADVITACEAFEPMAGCANQVLQDNGYEKSVHVVEKRSTDLSVGCDMDKRANMLIAELVDTELIGEAALDTYRHAADHLITEDATMVPYAADLFVQIVDSPFLWSHHKLVPFDENSTDLPLDPASSATLFSEAMRTCVGTHSVFDIQASELIPVDDGSAVLGEKQMRLLLREPLLVKRFHFAPPKDRIKLEEALCLIHDNHKQPLQASRAGTAHAFIVWWRLKMEPSDTVPDINSAPKWASTDPNDYAWRDHWMQGVYFPREPVPLHANQPFTINFSHDSFSLSFDMTQSTAHPPLMREPLNQPICECGMHRAWSRQRLAQLNSPSYHDMAKLTMVQVNSALSSLKPNQSVDVIVISDCSLLPLMLANNNNIRRQQASCQVNVIHVETCPLSEQFLSPIYAKASNTIQLFNSPEQVITKYEHADTALPDRILIVAEPYAAGAVLPWDSLHFWYTQQQLLSSSSSIPSIAKRTQLISPRVVRIYAILVEFEHLWKIRAPVGKACNKFDLSSFDALVQSAMAETDASVEPHSLWEYPSKARSLASIVFEMQLDTSPPFDKACIKVAEGNLLNPTSNGVNGIAFWAEWLIDSNVPDVPDSWYAPAKPRDPVVVNEIVQWPGAGVQQGVSFAPLDWPTTPSTTNLVTVKVEFMQPTGEFNIVVKRL